MALSTLLLVTAVFLLAPTTWLTFTNSVPVGPQSSKNASSTVLLYDLGDESEDCTADQEFVSPYDGSPRCCSVCEPGHGMVRLCTDTNETACGPCKPGKEFSSVRSAREKCQPCTICHNLDSRAKVKRSCSPNSNTVCECIPGYFFDAPQQNCRACTKCPPGQGVVSVCSFQNDTVCQACPPGTYSDITAGTVGCKPCRKCKSGHTEAQACKPDSNTLCCPKPPCDLEQLREMERNRTNSRVIQRPPIGDYDDRPEPSWKDAIVYKSSNGSSQDEAPDNSGKSVVTSSGLIPLYCGIMSLVIIILVVYVVYKWWQRRNAGSSNKATSSPGGSLLGATSGPASVFGGKRKAAAADVEGRINLMTYSKEGSPCGLMVSSNSPSHGMKRISDLSAKRMRQIELQLSQEKNGNGWSSLAKALDYSVNDISHFESQADLHRQPPVRFLLRDYSERPTATVAHMTKALQKCCRSDVIPLLKEHGTRAVSTAVTATTPNSEPRQCMEMGQV